MVEPDKSSEVRDFVNGMWITPLDPGGTHTRKDKYMLLTL
jgi:hypothetical protein